MPEQQNRNSGIVQSQAANQIAHGSQFYGNVSIHDGVPSNANSNEVAEPPTDKGDLLASLAFPGMLDREESIAQPHGRTCKWIFGLDQYQTWKRQPCGQLWITGSRGTGKSTLMASLSKTLRQQRLKKGGTQIVLNYFFYRQGSKLQKTFLGVLRSLLNQLLQQCPDVGNAVMTSYRDECAAYGSCKQAGAWEWQQRELEELLSQALIGASFRRQIIIFVDSIDEVGTHGELEPNGESVMTMMTYLDTVRHRVDMLRLDGMTVGLKFCVSCRLDTRESMREDAIEVCITDHNAGDIESYVHDEVAQILRTTGHQIDKEQWDKLTDKMLQHHSGWFERTCVEMQILVEESQNGGLPQDFEEIYNEVVPRLQRSGSTIDTSILFMPAG